MPGENYLEKILKAIEGRVSNGDIIVISEKAICVAKKLLINEENIKPSLLARFLARFWMRFVWGYFLGPLCHLKKRNVMRLRNYPLREGAAHKEVALRYAGFLHALMWGSEGGIDGSNLPYAYVSLPLKSAQQIAEEIHKYLKSRLGINLVVMIVDTDKTYSFRNFHFTHRLRPLKGIHTLLGFIAYVVGRSLKLKRKPTPLAVAGAIIGVDLALNIADIAEKARGHGSGSTVWDMAERFCVSLTGVTWDMLKRLEHKPIVIIKFLRP
ncbi:coenzyme F420-0:L-glutamate ligase [Candidatus Bathyarchaeota archaeon]|nr:coenzyme F420-0:L-glutamate ligase [Candidatus Bathyarchaeota archaeon]